MLMTRYRLTAEQAFSVLRRYSQASNVRLVVLAEELTGTGQLPDLDRRETAPTHPARPKPASRTPRGGAAWDLGEPKQRPR
jgi:hypothetical protein